MIIGRSYEWYIWTMQLLMVFMYRSQDENTDGLHLSITNNGTRCIISINYNIVTATLTYQPSSKLYTYRLLQGTHPTSLMTFTVSLARITVSLSTCIWIVMTNMSYGSTRHSASSRCLSYSLLTDSDCHSRSQHCSEIPLDEEYPVRLWHQELATADTLLSYVMSRLRRCNVQPQGLGLTEYMYSNCRTWKMCDVNDIETVSYTHLTLPTNREV